MDKLTPEQQTAVDKVRDGQHVMITGPAGTGKSFLISHLCDMLTQDGRLYALTAPSAVAALNIRGVTIHRFLGITPYVETLEHYQVWRRRVKSKIDWQALQAIIIDEVSMCHPEMFVLLSEICKWHLGNTRPFGGLQMIFIGDFLQLSPIHKGEVECKYVFQTALWAEMNVAIVHLKQIIRQKDPDFARALNDIRRGVLSTRARTMIDFCSNNKLQPGKKYTTLCSKKIECEIGNNNELHKLHTPAHVYRATESGDTKLLKDCLAEKIITLKVGATVMLVRNLPEDGLCNGSIGTVVDLESAAVQVQFNDDRTIWLGKVKWEILRMQKDRSPQVLASRSQIPLRLSWFISIHKSQSLSIDHVTADCKDIFTTAQLYVMLSRAKTKEGLIIKNFEPSALRADHVAVEFYEKAARPVKE